MLLMFQTGTFITYFAVGMSTYNDMLDVVNDAS
jgi:hypothetical protein